MEWLKSTWSSAKDKAQDLVESTAKVLPKQMVDTPAVEKAVGSPTSSTNLMGGKRRRTRRRRHTKKRRTHKH